MVKTTSHSLGLPRWCGSWTPPTATRVLGSTGHVFFDVPKARISTKKAYIEATLVDG